MTGPSLNAESLNAGESLANSAASPIGPADRQSAGGAPVEALAELRDRLKALAERQRFNRLEQYRPYPRQREFHKLGAAYRERLLSGGNQVGKTLCGGSEAAIHATGRYPDWWDGRRFDRPTVGIVGGATGELVREGPQRILCGRAGDPEAWGTGQIPRELLVDKTAARGTADLLDTILVRHASGGVSRVLLKAYAQGRVPWQTQTADWVWFDEEPPPEVYSEGLTRTNVSQGPVWLTFTPLLGMSQVAARFFLDPTAARVVLKMPLRDAEHYTAEQIATILASYPAHERAARGEGTPMLGSGAIFPVPEEQIVVQDFPVPSHWPRLGGLDFGYDHPFGAVEIAYEPAGDIVYLIRCYRQREGTPLIHAAALKPWGAALRFAWPHDGLQHDKGSGEQLAGQYRRHGLNMLAVRATFPDGTNHVEPGLLLMLDRMQTGRFKVFASCGDFLEEYRTYHRKDGKIVKEADDVICAARYAVMMLRYASAADAGDAAARRQTAAIEED